MAPIFWRASDSDGLYTKLSVVASGWWYQNSLSLGLWALGLGVLCVFMVIHRGQALRLRPLAGRTRVLPFLILEMDLGLDLWCGSQEPRTDGRIIAERAFEKLFTIRGRWASLCSSFFFHYRPLHHSDSFDLHHAPRLSTVSMQGHGNYLCGWEAKGWRYVQVRNEGPTYMKSIPRGAWRGTREGVVGSPSPLLSSLWPLQELLQPQISPWHR